MIYSESTIRSIVRRFDNRHPPEPEASKEVVDFLYLMFKEIEELKNENIQLKRQIKDLEEKNRQFKREEKDLANQLRREMKDLGKR